MSSNYTSRADYSNILSNIIAPLITSNINLYDSNVVKNYVNVDQYIQFLSSPSQAYAPYTTTTIKIGAPIKTSYGAIYKPWRCNPFAFVFDWFPGLIMVNNWPIELILQMSIYHELQQNEGILPFCLNISNQDRVDWDSCKDYSKINISAWQINKTSSKYPCKWVGSYFKENSVNNNYNGINHLAYWLQKWNEGYIPKICVYGLFDCNGVAEFNVNSATDDIYLTILNDKIPGQIENVHIDVYSAGENCGSFRKDWEIILTEEVTVNLSTSNINLPTGAISGTAIPNSTSMTSTQTVIYPPGIVPLPAAGQSLIKIDPNTGSTWTSFDGGITWYIEDPYTHLLSGPFDEPYWGMYTKVEPPGGSPYWVNPWSGNQPIPWPTMNSTGI